MSVHFAVTFLHSKNVTRNTPRPKENDESLRQGYHKDHYVKFSGNGKEKSAEDYVAHGMGKLSSADQELVEHFEPVASQNTAMRFCQGMPLTDALHAAINQGVRKTLRELARNASPEDIKKAVLYFNISLLHTSDQELISHFSDDKVKKLLVELSNDYPVSAFKSKNIAVRAKGRYGNYMRRNLKNVDSNVSVSQLKEAMEMLDQKYERLLD